MHNKYECCLSSYRASPSKHLAIPPGSEGDVYHFDTTGMFHWVPDIEMEACLIVSLLYPVYCLSVFDGVVHRKENRWSLSQLKLAKIITFNGSQLVKMKKNRFLTCPCHKIYRVEAVGLSMSNYTKKYDFYENVKFGAIL